MAEMTNADTNSTAKYARTCFANYIKPDKSLFVMAY